MKDPIPHQRAGLVLFCLAILTLIAAMPATAQEEGLPEIPLTFRSPVSARHAGMGGASLAIADDYSACLSNPATLGLVRGIEFAIGFTHQNAERDVRFLGNTETAEFGRTRISHLGFAYPFPTYRGRFVVGFQYGRVGNLDYDFFKKGSSSRIIHEEEGIFEEGGMNAYAMSAAFQISPSVTLGATGTILGGGDYRERTFYQETSSYVIDDYQEYDADISGLTGSFGALVELNRGIRFGVTVQLPQDIDFEGVFYEQIDGDIDEFTFTDEITLPFRLGGGVAVARRNLIMAFDAIYTDWSQIDFAGPLRTANREFAYRQTVDLHIGAEYLLSLPSPVRLRAGYAYQPLAYRLLLTDVVAPRYEEARFDTDRHYLTFGLGMLLGETVTMDLAYMHGGYERSAVEASEAGRFTEEEKDRRLLASLSVRIN